MAKPTEHDFLPLLYEFIFTFLTEEEGGHLLLPHLWSGLLVAWV